MFLEKKQKFRKLKGDQFERARLLLCYPDKERFAIDTILKRFYGC